MSRPPKPPNKDQKIWDEVAESITPIKDPKLRVRHGSNSTTEESQPPIGQPAQTVKNNPNAPPTAPLSAHKTRSTVPHKVPGLADFDKKSNRRLRSGRIEIAARLDLHGMRQHEAHAALRGFLSSAQARGLRWVLVITGKGAPAYDLDHESDEPWLAAPNKGRGILRQSVPQWLAEPEFRTVVVSHTTAAQHHGGEGARYIQLRAKRRNT